jgi:hypothetical protein
VAARSIRAAAGEGKTGRVNCLNPATAAVRTLGRSERSGRSASSAGSTSARRRRFASGAPILATHLRGQKTPLCHRLPGVDCPHRGPRRKGNALTHRRAVVGLAAVAVGLAGTGAAVAAKQSSGPTRVTIRTPESTAYKINRYLQVGLRWNRDVYVIRSGGTLALRNSPGMRQRHSRCCTSRAWRRRPPFSERGVWQAALAASRGRRCSSGAGVSGGRGETLASA